MPSQYFPNPVFLFLCWTSYPAMAALFGSTPSMTRTEPSASIDQRASCQRQVLQFTSMSPCFYDRIGTVFFLTCLVCVSLGIFRWSDVQPSVCCMLIKFFYLLFYYFSNKLLMENHTARNCSSFSRFS